MNSGSQPLRQDFTLQSGKLITTPRASEPITCRDQSSQDDANSCDTNKHVQVVQRHSLIRLMQAFLREKMFSVSQNNNSLVFLLPHTARAIHIDNVSLGSLDRYTDFGNIYLHEKNQRVRELNHPLEVLEIFKAEANLSAENKSWEKLSSEIEDHLRNALLSSYTSCEQKIKIQTDAKLNDCTNLLQWLALNDEVKNKNLFFEQFISRGHPYHPCSKTKLGFSADDVVKYSPEFQPEIPVVIAAVKKDRLHITSMYDHADFASWFAANYRAAWNQWTLALTEKQLPLEDYSPFPIHPWQLNNVVLDLFADFIASGELVILDNVSINTTPTLSFRSLAPVNEMQSAYIKLPIAVQATSVFRTLSAASTENTPAISRVFHDIFLKENDFGHRLSILCEPFGLHLKNIPDEQAKNLTAIFRENPNVILSDDETCIVVAALFERSPISSDSVFIELMHSAGVTQLEQAIPYFHHYVDVLLGGYLDIYLLYGVALEGHQQNTLAVFRNGSISRFIARDFDGTYIHTKTLNDRGYYFQQHPTSSMMHDDIVPVRHDLLHTVFQSHVGELVLLLAQHFHCEERVFWNVVKTVTEQRFNDLKDKIDLQTWEEEYQGILQTDWPCKALLRMRLRKKVTSSGIFFDIENPLSALNQESA